MNGGGSVEEECRLLTGAPHHAGQVAAGAVDAVIQRVGYPPLVVVLWGVHWVSSNWRELLQGPNNREEARRLARLAWTKQYVKLS